MIEQIAAIELVYAHCVDKIIGNIASHFDAKTETNSGTVEWQTLKLAEMGQINKETAGIIASMSGEAYGLTDDAMLAALKSVIAKEGVAGNQMSSAMRNILRYYAAQAHVKQNLVNTVMLTDSLNGYRRIIASVMQSKQVLRDTVQGVLNTATGEVITGVASHTKAVRDALKELVKNGITGFVDKGGRRWEPDAYIAMDIRTTTGSVANEASFQQAREIAGGLVIWPVNASARPGCFPWQGKVCSVNGFSGYVKDANGQSVRVYPMSETTYGQPDGIGGINCHHSPPDPFIAGFSTYRPREINKEQSDRRYAETQRQRYLEREVRAAKREALVLREANDQNGFEEVARVIKSRQRDLDDYIKKVGLTKRPDRVQVLGYDRSVSAKVRQVKPQSIVKIQEQKSLSERQVLSNRAREIFVQENASLGYGEAVKRFESLIDWNTTAQLRKYVAKHTKN